MSDNRDPMDWIRENCTQTRGKDLWRWPSGYLHTETRSVAIVTMHWAMGREPTDMLTAPFAWVLLDRLLILEKQVSELLARVELGMSSPTSPSTPIADTEEEPA